MKTRTLLSAVCVIFGCATNLFADSNVQIETETRDGIVYKKSGDLETHVRDV